MALQLTFGEASATGPRSENQDAIRVVTPAPALAASKGYLFALADGVSQCADGGLAARATLQALALDYYSTPETWAVTQSLDRVLVAHNRWLQANGGGQPLLTTLSALILRGRRFTLAHVGDCRAYRWLNGTLERLSEDHVWEQPGMQHVLKRAMGLDQHLVMDYLDGELREGECFVLVSDGIWATLGDAGIQRILHDEQDLPAASRALVNAAHLAGSQDNASALLLRVEALPQSDLADTLAQLASHLQHLLSQMTGGGQRCLAELTLLDPAQQQRIVDDWNLIGEGFAADYHYHLIFSGQRWYLSEVFYVDQDGQYESL